MLRKIHHFIQIRIIRLIDFFYPYFRKYLPFVPLQTFRYAVAGGGTQVLNILIYYFSLHYVLRKEILHLPAVAISAHIASWLMAFCVTFPLGFYLNYAVVFSGSYLRRRIQLMRYLGVVLICVFLNYILLKLFVERFLWYPTIAYMVTTVLVTVFSYLTQRNFSFKHQKSL